MRTGTAFVKATFLNRPQLISRIAHGLERKLEDAMERNGACTMLLLNTRHEDPTLHIGRVTPYYDTVAVLMSLTRMTNSMTERGMR